jgi:hypothetical protein
LQVTDLNVRSQVNLLLFFSAGLGENRAIMGENERGMWTGDQRLGLWEEKWRELFLRI